MPPPTRNPVRTWGAALTIGLAFGAIGLHVTRNVLATPGRGADDLDQAAALKSNQMAEYAYQTGCYEAYIRACGRIDDDEMRGGCHREGLRNCRGDAKTFREWIESGRKGP